jgi:hypothetical protein
MHVRLPLFRRPGSAAILRVWTGRQRTVEIGSDIGACNPLPLDPEAAVQQERAVQRNCAARHVAASDNGPLSQVHHNGCNLDIRHTNSIRARAPR